MQTANITRGTDDGNLNSKLPSSALSEASQHTAGQKLPLIKNSIMKSSRAEGDGAQTRIEHRMNPVSNDPLMSV